MGSAGQNGFHDTALAPGPGVVVGRSGASFGRVHYCPIDYWPHNTALYVTNFKGNHPQFVYYLLSTIDFSRYNSGSAQPSLNRNYIYSIPMTFPRPVEQRAIAHILGTLDDKIELNRRMNETLEAMARAIFKSWFVDFDPVRAKMRGEQPAGLAPHIAALFPDELVETELGEAPVGWSIGVLEDMVVVQRGFDLPANDRIPGPYQVIAASGPSTFHCEAKVKGPGVVTGRSGVLGKVFLVEDDFWPLNTTLWVKEFRRSGPYHAYFMLQQIDFSVFNAGSAVPTLNRNHIHNLPMVIPSGVVQNHYESIARPIWGKLKANQIESNTLAALRDTLLPKLISGELRVADAERIVGRSV
jgi:type I restriction enzyme S subunit